MKKQNSHQSADKVYVVARYFMQKSRRAKRQDFTNRKLQKLLFYAQAWSLALDNKRLFNETFKARIHGASIPKVHEIYMQYGFDVITEPVNVAELKQLSASEKDILNNVWNVYGKHDAEYLEVLMHEEDPWQKARQSAPDGMRSDADISEKLMKTYYSQKLKESEEAD